MSKIKVRIVKFERGFAFQILEQSFRPKDDMRNAVYYETSNGITIKSHRRPSIFAVPKSIFIRGTDVSEDFEVSALSFQSNSARDLCIMQIGQALKNWVDNWDGFPETEESTVDPDPEIYEF